LPASSSHATDPGGTTVVASYSSTISGPGLGDGRRTTEREGERPSSAVRRPPSRPGPLIVEEYDATTVVPPGCAAWLDEGGNIVIEVG
jgi:hypothetical protein